MNIGGSASALATEPSFDAELVELEWLRSADVSARLTRARDVERRADLAGDEHAVMRARLVVGDMLHRVGDVTGGARLALTVHAWANANGARQLLARSHLVLSSMFEGIGDPSSTLEHAVRAIDLVDDTFTARDRGTHLLRLADALAFAESADQSRRRYREAEAVFRTIDDRERMLIVLNNLAVLESELGEPADAVAAADQLARSIGPDDECSDYSETIARARLVGGDVDGAIVAAEHGMRLLADQGDSKAHSGAELALTHAEALLASDRLDEAQQVLDSCVGVCEERHLGGMLARSMELQAQLFAARGMFEHAYRAHREFHAATMRLRWHQQEAAARAREALFETAEARREAEQFRMQARIDPLTDLYNRRHLDETLPEWLAESGGSPAAVSVAIVDIDRFKTINDQLSHEVGDDVLRRIAGMLDRLHHDGDHGFVARIGGEEFVVVDRWTDPEIAAARVEAIRRAVETHDWLSVSPGLQVTISAGIATARAGDTQRALLSRADRALYEAKESGRNRVVRAT